MSPSVCASINSIDSNHQIDNLDVNIVNASKGSVNGITLSTGAKKTDPFLEPFDDLIGRLQLRADRQSYDARLKRFIAEGNVSVLIEGSLLKADRIEFDIDFKTLLKRNGKIKKYINYKEIEEIFDLNYHLKNIDKIFKKVLGKK